MGLVSYNIICEIGKGPGHLPSHTRDRREEQAEGHRQEDICDPGASEVEPLGIRINQCVPECGTHAVVRYLWRGRSSSGGTTCTLASVAATAITVTANWASSNWRSSDGSQFWLINGETCWR